MTCAINIRSLHSVGMSQETGTGVALLLTHAPDKTTQNCHATQAKHTCILVDSIFLHA